MEVNVSRNQIIFAPDSSRIIARFLHLNDERAAILVQNVLDMSKEEMNVTQSQLLRGYARRHRNISRTLSKNFAKIQPVIKGMGINPDSLSPQQQSLIGAYFTMEYSIESAAFFNPSMVASPDQTELRSDEKRVIISFRATGEGHISSIVFRAGVLDKNNDLILEPSGKMLAEADKIKRHIYNKKEFKRKLQEMHEGKRMISPGFVLDKLGDEFTYGELMKNIASERDSEGLTEEQVTLLNHMTWLASSHYEVNFSIDSAISERVIFPISATEQRGIEDARFVQFFDEDGKCTYYATYTAFDGIAILPKLIETRDFYNFKIMPINGEIAQNKGMALFPRKIKGKYAMLCRIDGVNNYIAYSDKINIWREAKIIQKPRYPWELVQIGNSGSPIETDEGWLVITHAVGPMREYTLSASLYDLDDPEIEIGRLSTPLIEPNEMEREGYVPNVVYSCGSIIHNGEVVIPYAMSDYASTYATVNLEELLTVLKAGK
ncbi:MAG: glycoside hydrolase family 130 protein [Lentimicrobiaceae bacterium]|nr:glycoside hydrolase family 130 protein [Lentimicrobiaceae bacterium]